MIARVYYSSENSELLGIESYLKQKGFAVEKVPVASSVNEVSNLSFGGGNASCSLRIVINNSSYNSVGELFEAERKGELPTLLRG